MRLFDSGTKRRSFLEEKRSGSIIMWKYDDVKSSGKAFKRHLKWILEDFQKLMLFRLLMQSTYFPPEIRSGLKSVKNGQENMNRGVLQSEAERIRKSIRCAGFAGTGKSEFCKGNQNAIDLYLHLSILIFLNLQVNMEQRQ